jgi:polyisoprenoid-binding protein YceI
MMRSKYLAGAVGVVMAGALGFGALRFVYRDVAPQASLQALAAATPSTSDAAARPTLSLAPPASSGATPGVPTTAVEPVAPQNLATPSPLDGTWTIQQGDGVFAGYRIDELAAGSTLKSTATGRSLAVSGQLAVSGSLVTGATITVDMTKLTSDMASRDGFMRIAGLRTADFREATFTVTSSFDLGSIPTGADLSVSVPGTLTLKGVSAPATIAIEARFDGTALLLAGQAPIVLSDFDIDPPTNPFVSVEPRGVMEFQLRFVRS